MTTIDCGFDAYTSMLLPMAIQLMSHHSRMLFNTQCRPAADGIEDAAKVMNGFITTCLISLVWVASATRRNEHSLAATTFHLSEIP